MSHLGDKKNAKHKKLLNIFCIVYSHYFPQVGAQFKGIHNKKGGVGGKIFFIILTYTVL